MEIPLRRKYTVHKPVKRMSSKHNDATKKRSNGWAKHRWGKGTNHTPWVMVLDALTGKRRVMPRDAWEAANAPTEG